jgi:hypothetical protein
LDWLIWFLLPRGADRIYMRERIDGTYREDAGSEARVFWLLVQLCVVVAAIAITVVAGKDGGVGQAVVAGAIGFGVALTVWTIAPGVSSVRAWRNQGDDRWARRNPYTARQVRRARGRTRGG